MVKISPNLKIMGIIIISFFVLLWLYLRYRIIKGTMATDMPKLFLIKEKVNKGVKEE